MAPSMRLNAMSRPPASHTATLILMFISRALSSAPCTTLFASASVSDMSGSPFGCLSARWIPAGRAVPSRVRVRANTSARPVSRIRLALPRQPLLLLGDSAGLFMQRIGRLPPTDQPAYQDDDEDQSSDADMPKLREKNE